MYKRQINEDVKVRLHEMMRAKCVCGPTRVPGKFYVAFRRVDSSGSVRPLARFTMGFNEERSYPVTVVTLFPRDPPHEATCVSQ